MYATNRIGNVRTREMAEKATPAKGKSQTNADDFESVARRLECDPDLKKFDDQLRKIAKAKGPATGSAKGGRK